MKVISLLQPWAYFAAAGIKKIETRSWDTSFRGYLLIHASKKMSPLQKKLCNDAPFKYYLENVEELRLGGIIGKVKVSFTKTTEEIVKTPVIKFPGIDYSYNDHEEYFGDYSPNRFGWFLSEPVLFKHFIPVKGSLSLWDFNDRICLSCGCTEYDCRQCIEKTGLPCHWVAINKCSACV